VGALGEEGHKDHQIRKGEKPLIGLEAGTLGCTGNKAQVAAPGKIAEMIDANACEGSNLSISEDFLARLDGNHGRVPRFFPGVPLTFCLMLRERYAMHAAKSNSRSVL
jgi:hypothetical protein